VYMPWNAAPVKDQTPSRGILYFGEGPSSLDRSDISPYEAELFSVKRPCGEPRPFDARHDGHSRSEPRVKQVGCV
jgi:hypothetical protein